MSSSHSLAVDAKTTLTTSSDSKKNTPELKHFLKNASQSENSGFACFWKENYDVTVSSYYPIKLHINLQDDCFQNSYIQISQIIDELANKYNVVLAGFKYRHPSIAADDAILKSICDTILNVTSRLLRYEIIESLQAKIQHPLAQKIASIIIKDESQAEKSLAMVNSKIGQAQFTIYFVCDPDPVICGEFTRLLNEKLLSASLVPGTLPPNNSKLSPFISVRQDNVGVGTYIGTTDKDALLLKILLENSEFFKNFVESFQAKPEKDSKTDLKKSAPPLSPKQNTANDSNIHGFFKDLKLDTAPANIHSPVPASEVSKELKPTTS